MAEQTAVSTRTDGQEPRLVVACMIAPLVAPLVLLLIILAIGWNARGPSYQYSLNTAHEMLGIIGLFLGIGAPIAYAVTLVLGLPLYFLFKKLRLINFWSITFGAAFVAVLPIALLSLSADAPVNEAPRASIFWFYSAFAVCGYAVGTVFWLVSGLNKSSAHGHAHG